jgi:hypothetical protein
LKAILRLRFAGGIFAGARNKNSYKKPRIPTAALYLLYQSINSLPIVLYVNVNTGVAPEQKRAKSPLKGKEASPRSTPW